VEINGGARQLNAALDLEPELAELNAGI
jgi:hypothetical protein